MINAISLVSVKWDDSIDKNVTLLIYYNREFYKNIITKS